MKIEKLRNESVVSRYISLGFLLTLKADENFNLNDLSVYRVPYKEVEEIYKSEHEQYLTILVFKDTKNISSKIFICLLKGPNHSNFIDFTPRQKLNLTKRILNIEDAIDEEFYLVNYSNKIVDFTDSSKYSYITKTKADKLKIVRFK